MKITAIIANRNNGEYLPDAIEACLNQTIPVNVAVCDDASTDSSVGIIAKYQKQGRVQAVYNQVNLGPSESRNRLIERNLDSDFFLICDADDIPDHKKVETLLSVVNNTTGVVYADYRTLNTATQIITNEYKQSYSKERLFNNCITHSAALISKQYLVQNQIRPGEYYENDMRTCEDWSLFLRMSRNSMILHVPEILTTVRVTPNNSSNAINLEVWQSNWRKIGERIKSGFYN